MNVPQQSKWHIGGSEYQIEKEYVEILEVSVRDIENIILKKGIKAQRRFGADDK